MLTIGEFAAFWIFSGVLGAILAGRLMLFAAEDRGTLRISGLNGPYRLINQKMMREGLLRFSVAMFAVFVGIVAFIGRHPIPRPPISATGMALSLGFTFVKTGNVLVCLMDLRDRDLLIRQEGGLHANLGPASPR